MSARLYSLILSCEISVACLIYIDKGVFSSPPSRFRALLVRGFSAVACAIALANGKRAREDEMRNERDRISSVRLRARRFWYVKTLQLRYSRNVQRVTL